MEGSASRGGALTTPEFWDSVYLSPLALPSRPSSEMPFERCLMRAFVDELDFGGEGRLLELGCAPGRWLVYFAERFGMRVEGLEYSAFGAAQTRENLRLCGVDGIVHEGDFWTFEAAEPYDVLLSLGFIEHFSDVDEALARHATLVRPGGTIVLTVPNFQGLNRFLQRRFDPDWLALHNLEAMGHRRYAELAPRHGLELVSYRYTGGFDPDVISTRRRGRKLLAPLWHLRHRGFGDRIDAQWLSSFLLVVLRRTARASV